MLIFFRSTETAFVLYKVSFLWHSLLSLVLTISIGMLVSILYNWMSCKKEKTENSELDSPPTIKTSTTVINSGANSGTCKLLLKDGLKDENALKVSIQGKVPTATEFC